jgi:hypothetical protein
MIAEMSGNTGTTITVAHVAVFLVVLVFCYETFKGVGIFGPGSRMILSLCTAFLATIGLQRFMEVLLIPFAALVLTLVTVVLFGLFRLLCIAKRYEESGGGNGAESGAQEWSPFLDEETDARRKEKQLKRMD